MHLKNRLPTHKFENNINILKQECHKINTNMKVSDSHVSVATQLYMTKKILKMRM